MDRIELQPIDEIKTLTHSFMQSEEEGDSGNSEEGDDGGSRDEGD